MKKAITAGSKRILVLAAHPDDEITGCGGTVALHTRSGDIVTSVIVCEAESLRYGKVGVGMRSHSMNAAKKLGISDLRLLNFPDQKLDTFTLTDIITPIEKIVREVKPNIVYTHHYNDINLDHQILVKAVSVATRPMEKFIEAVYSFDAASSTEWAYPRTFIPDTWVDISETLDLKLSAFSCYESEVRPYPHPRSLKSLRFRAKAWGSQVCVDAAEAFMTVRRVLRKGKRL